MQEPLPIHSIGMPWEVPAGLDQQFPLTEIIPWLAGYDIKAMKVKSLDVAAAQMTHHLAQCEGDVVLIQGDGLVQSKVRSWIGIAGFKPKPLIEAFTQGRIADLFMYHPGSDQFFSAQTEEYDYWIITMPSNDFIAFKNQ